MGLRWNPPAGNASLRDPVDWQVDGLGVAIHSAVLCWL